MDRNESCFFINEMWSLYSASKSRYSRSMKKKYQKCHFHTIKTISSKEFNQFEKTTQLTFDSLHCAHRVWWSSGAFKWNCAHRQRELILQVWLPRDSHGVNLFFCYHCKWVSERFIYHQILLYIVAWTKTFNAIEMVSMLLLL